VTRDPGDPPLVIPCTLGWANPDTGPESVRLYALDAGAPEDGPVRVVVSRLHRVRRVEVEFGNPDAPEPSSDAPGSA
jgi:hypothetical protein